MKYEDEFQRIIEASENHTLSFFVGAGVSSLSGAPSWKKLIQEICKQIDYTVKEDYSSDENLRIPQIFYHSIDQDKDKYYKFMDEQLGRKEFSTNPVHRELLSFNPVSFITTNFDDLLETAAIENCQSFISVACDNEVSNINGNKYILKLHGDIEHQNIVFKEEDYLNYSENFKLIETLLKSIFSMNTVVFVGYGLNDYNIKLVLNWAKSLLKDQFNKPIFIYTDNNPLSDAELLYHESRGLCVIESSKVEEKVSEDYLSRYMAVLKAIKASKDISIAGKTKEEAFEILYQVLKPLDKLQALRRSDVAQRLEDYVIISETGQIFVLPYDYSHLFIEFFYEINCMSAEEYNLLEKETQEKYCTIVNVFKKAHIHSIKLDFKSEYFIKETASCDSLCIYLDYLSMYKIVYETKADTVEEKYRKAFYLSRLKKYDKAYNLFAEIAREAFKSKDYLLYYLCKSNCISLKKIIEPLQSNYSIYPNMDVNGFPSTDNVEKLFENLPIEFQDQYKNLKDLFSPTLLYKYSYEASLDSQKLQKAIETNTVEFGQTSIQKVEYRIHDYLFFLLNNGIIADVFSEYKNTVKNLMSVLVYKFAEQEKKILHNQPFPEIVQDKVIFDNISFYCFIEYFTGDEIEKLFSKNHIEKITFNDGSDIESVIYNIIDYYKYLINDKETKYEQFLLQQQIKTLLVLLGYIDLTQKSVDYVCDFILKYEVIDVHINDIILFLYQQIYKRKKYSDITAKVIKDKLLNYLDQHIEAIEAKRSFLVRSTNSSINYPNLIHYIFPFEERKYMEELTIRISRILKNDLNDLRPSVIEYYWDYLSKYMKNKIIRKVKSHLKQEFDFEWFKFLILCNAKIDDEYIICLKQYLHEMVKKHSDKDEKKIIYTYPSVNPYNDLEQVGYWCLIKKLKKEDFLEFTGISSVFDFYIQYKDFDFTKFEVSWLLNLYSHAIDIISKNKQVKENICACIKNQLEVENISEVDRDKLVDILIKHF